MNRLLFKQGSFETIRTRLNTDEGIPPEGRNGFRNGKEVTDGTGKTMDYILPVYNETLNKDVILKIDELPQYVIDAAEEDITEEEYFKRCPIITEC